MNGLLFECGPVSTARTGYWCAVQNPYRVTHFPVALQVISGTGTVIIEGRNHPDDTPVQLASESSSKGLSVPAFRQMRVKIDTGASNVVARVSIGGARAIPVGRTLDVYPGDDILAVYASALPGDTVRVFGDPTEDVTVYDLGAAALTPTSDFVRLEAGPGFEPVLRGLHGRYYPLGVYAVEPRIVLTSSGPNVINWTNRHGPSLTGFDVVGGTYDVGTSGSGVAVLRGTRTRVKYNRIRGADVCGISGDNAGSRIENNEFTDNSGEQVAGISGAIKVVGSGVLVRRNYVHDNHVYGIWRDCNSTSWFVRDNIIVNNAGSGVFNEICSGGEVTGNYFENNSLHTAGRFEMVVTSSKELLVKGNVFRTGGTEDSPLRALYIREDDRAGVSDADDKDYNSDVTNPCQIGFRSDEIIVEGNLFLNGDFAALQWDNETPVVEIDPTEDEVYANENDTSPPAVGVTFRRNRAETTEE